MRETKFAKSETFYCDCNSDEHQFRMEYLKFDPVDPEPQLYMSVFLNQWRGFFHRLWIAMKYLCGYTCKFGHFDNVLLNKTEAIEVRDFIQAFLDEYKVE